MKNLQEALENTLKDAAEGLLSDLLAKKLAEHGVNLSQRERKSLAAQVLAKNGTFVLQDWKFWDRRQLALELTADDQSELECKLAKLESATPEIIENVTDRLSTVMLDELKERWAKESKAQQKERVSFRKRLHERWKTPLELLRMLLTICREVGDGLNRDLTSSPERATRAHLIEMLRRSHARACQIVDEVLTLLQGGFADGAMARWRTLHEIAVTVTFVAEHGEELAERYVAHQFVEAKRAAEEYQRCVERLGYEPIPADDMKTILDDYAKVIATYGKDFKGSYGWAAHHLGIPEPNFSQIERAVEVDHMRSHYRMARHNVHANPKAIFFRLGLAPEAPILLAGASNSGLAEPGQGAALSLAQVTSVFGTLQPTMDSNVGIRLSFKLRTLTTMRREFGSRCGATASGSRNWTNNPRSTRRRTETTPLCPALQCAVHRAD